MVLKYLRNQQHGFALRLFQCGSDLWLAGKHGTKYLLDTFQDLACNESQHRTVVISGVGAGVVSVLLLGFLANSLQRLMVRPQNNSSTVDKVMVMLHSKYMC